jgi:hypothetical protein
VTREDFEADGIPWTRASYINVAYLGDTPDPWTAEHEAELPGDLRDWSLFEQVGSELVYKGPAI